MLKSKKEPIKTGINLLRESTAPKTFWENFYVWALTIGRYIIVGTGAVVLSVLISRFSLDRQIMNIRSNLRAKISLLETFKDTEEDARELQNLMLLGTSLEKQQEPKAFVYNEIIQIQPENSEIELLRIEGNELTISAYSNDITAFYNFEDAFKRRKDLLYDVRITKTEKEDNSGYELNLFAKIISPEFTL